MHTDVIARRAPGVPRAAIPAAVLAAAVLLGASQGAAAQQAELDTVVVAPREVVRERVLDGIVEPVQESTVSAQTAGRIVEINYDVDDYVPQGAVILRFRDTEQRAQVLQAEADVRRARAGSVEAEENFGRVSDLYGRDVVSRAEFEAAKARLDATKAALQAGEAALEQAREQLDYTVIRAPYPGVVTARHVELGETAGIGEPLMSGFSLEHLRVRVDVPQRAVEAIRERRRARVVSFDDAARAIEAASVTVFPFASEGSNTVRVRVGLPPGVKNLYPGMLVKVAFEVGSRRLLAVPATALLRRSEVVGVYVVGDDGRIRLRQVRPGQELADGFVEVLAGLASGERVAVDALRAAVRRKQSSAP